MNLTRRESQVIHCLARGMTLKEIAAKYRVSLKTVETHRSNGYRRIGVHSMVEATRYLATKELAGVNRSFATLTEKEQAAVNAYGDGLSGVELARRAGVKQQTVFNWVWRVRRKLGLTTLAAFVRYAVIRKVATLVYSVKPA